MEARRLTALPTIVGKHLLPAAALPTIVGKHLLRPRIVTLEARPLTALPTIVGKHHLPTAALPTIAGKPLPRPRTAILEARRASPLGVAIEPIILVFLAGCQRRQPTDTHCLTARGSSSGRRQPLSSHKWDPLFTERLFQTQTSRRRTETHYLRC